MTRPIGTMSPEEVQHETLERLRRIEALLNRVTRLPMVRKMLGL